MNNEFNEAFSLFNKDIYRLAYSYVLNKTDAEDIVQKVFLKLYKNLGKINRNQIEIKKWLIRVTINESINVLKYNKKKTHLEFSEETIPTKKKSYTYNTIDTFKKLPPNYRIPLYLFYYEGFTIEEIAKIMKKKTSSIKMRLSRGRAILKKEIER